MGLFEWIGEAIGGALAALAEFMGDAGNVVIRGVFAGATSLGNDLLKLILSELGGSETEIKLTASAILTDVDKRVFTDTKDIIDAALAVEGETTPEEASKALEGLWDTNKIGLQQAMIDNMIAEAVSLGQFDSLFRFSEVYNKSLGLLEINSTISMMKYKAAWLNSFQRHVNKKYPNIIPGPTDLVRMQLREVFHKDYRPELLKPPPSATFNTAMEEHGYAKYWSDSYWAAHWVLPSMGDLDEMLHRRIIEPEEWETMVRRNDYLPAWIDNRKKIIYKPYTRVDTRRMLDLALLSPEEVLNNYKDLGYDEEHAERMTIWSKAYILSVELRARYSKGWINAEDVLTEIVAAGVPKKRAEVWIQKIIKPEKETRTEKERDVTKSEIIKGVKTGILIRSEAIELLVGMGYDEDEADYILEINIPIDEEDEVVKARALGKADILNALKTDVMSREEAKEKLMEIRYSSNNAETLLDIFDSQITVPPTPRAREASKADIVLGVKKGLISQEEAYGMLLDLGFTATAAMFILTVKTEESPFSAINKQEFWDLVNMRRKALGLPVKEPPKEPKKAGKGTGGNKSSRPSGEKNSRRSI